MAITVDQALAVAGILIAVIFGVIGLYMSNGRRKSQRQNVQNQSVGIQIGGDVRITGDDK